MRGLFAAALSLIFAGCSLDAAGKGDELSDGTAWDVSIATDSERADSIFVLDDTAPPVCDESACGTLPAGGKRVALVDSDVACPAGFDSTDVVEETAGDGCGCSCALAAAPTCPGAGAITTSAGDMPSCATAGATLSTSDGSMCSPIGATVTLLGYYRATAPAALGGACGATPSTAAVSKPRRICSPRPGTCVAPTCATPFAECVEIAGTCPWAFPKPRRIGSSASVACPACTCALSGASCTGTLTLYDAGCTGTAVASLRADGTCSASPGGTGNFASFKYTPNAPTGTTCSASYATAPGTRSFADERHLCCR